MPDSRFLYDDISLTNSIVNPSMDAVIHSATTLRYLLLTGRTRLEPLRIFERRRVTWLDHRVTFYALGTSHAIRFEYGDIALTELLTCVPTAVQGHVLEHGGERVPYSVSRTFDNLSYRCRLTPFILSGRDGLQGAFSCEDQLTFNYRVEGDLEEPITHIGWSGRESTLSVETVHTYPHEGRGVRSKSTFEISCRAEAVRGSPAARPSPLSGKQP